jgi:hypothetical protein
MVSNPTLSAIFSETTVTTWQCGLESGIFDFDEPLYLRWLYLRRQWQRDGRFIQYVRVGSVRQTAQRELDSLWHEW